MNKETILIYDDDPESTKDFKCKLEIGLNKAGQSKNFIVVSMDGPKFFNSIKALEQRRIQFRKGEIDLENSPKDNAEEIDNASIFIIDYDLLDSQEKNEKKLSTGFLTGEIVAYLVRCFSRCKLIIGLNQYGTNPFDLTLKGEIESFADLNLGGDQLNNSDLWTVNWEDSRRGFRPWSWPILSNFIRDFEKRVDDIQENLNKPICEVLKFDSEVFQLLPREIVQFIGKYEEKEPFQTTFRDFVTQSGNGLSAKDSAVVKEGINEYILARVGAARISKWLEQLVLPEQDIFVDAPHLVSRYPSLITGDTGKIGTWNKIAQLVNYHELELNTELIEGYQFPKECCHWVSRPVWFWDKLRECGDIKEVTEPWSTVRPNWVFCEDASRFYARNECKEFLADMSSPYTRRYAKGFKKVIYRPKVRFSL